MKFVKNKILFFLFVILVFPVVARADMAPRTFNQGGVIYAGNKTAVEMSAEKVVFSNLHYRIIPDTQESVLVSDVDASFVMNNTSSKEEKMNVYFPFYFDFQKEWGFDNGIYDIEVLVNNKKISFTEDHEKNEIFFSVNFPAQAKTNVEIKYSNTSSPVYWSELREFEYVLHSGSGWKNVIGEGEIIFELPYPSSDENILLSDALNVTGNIADLESDSQTKFRDKYELRGNQLIYSFKDLEPTEEDDLSFIVFDPKLWNDYQKVLAEVKNKPSYEAYMKLAKMDQDYYTDHSGQYFASINQALEYKYPEKKDLAYFQEASEYYSHNWEIADGKYYNFYQDISSLTQLRDELLISQVADSNSESSQAKQELLNRINSFLLNFSEGQKINQNKVENLSNLSPTQSKNDLHVKNNDNWQGAKEHFLALSVLFLAFTFLLALVFVKIFKIFKSK